MNDDSLLMRLASGRRLQAVQPPIIPAIVALIRAHPGTISLGQGIVHYGPPPQAIARVKACLSDPDIHGYGPSHGLSELKQAISAKLHLANGKETVAEGIGRLVRGLKALVTC